MAFTSSHLILFLIRFGYVQLKQYLHISTCSSSGKCHVIYLYKKGSRCILKKTYIDANLSLLNFKFSFSESEKNTYLIHMQKNCAYVCYRSKSVFAKLLMCSFLQQCTHNNFSRTSLICGLISKFYFKCE